MGIYIQYIYITKIVVLVSEPVRGRSRATELPCSSLLYLCLQCDEDFMTDTLIPLDSTYGSPGPPRNEKEVNNKFVSDYFHILHVVGG